MRAVKTKRRYDSRRRDEQARQTRQAVLDAAEQLFLGSGFGATTIASIAAHGEVSVETVYKSFGGKPGLVRAICARALGGSGPVPAETRSDELSRGEVDPRDVIRGWGRLGAEVAPRVVPILLLVRQAAAVDNEMAELRDELDARRLARMTHNAEALAPHYRSDVTVALAAEVLWTYSSAELFELLVLRRGWSPTRYGEFIAEAMIAALLPPTATPATPAATART